VFPAFKKRKENVHELPVIESIMNISLKHAKTHKVSKIIAIHLEVGEMSDLEDQWMQSYFDHLSKDTIAQGAQLKIQRMPVVMKCDSCGESFTVDLKSGKTIACEKCQSEKNLTFVSGREYRITNMEAI
jgi:hydrogenase nickel incorporation protein HypA/HybF